MPIATRTFRVFVSSTFGDLKKERDALQRKVFPALQEFCESHSARLQAIDLRWGVREEASLDQQTMEICLHEIERCQKTGIKPNFIVLLGDRYGWRPVRARIPAMEFESLLGRIEDATERELVESWYQRDDNAVPPERLLRPRTGDFVDRDCWRQVEEDLHRILREAARAAGLSGEALMPYVASATHQEILKGLGATEQDREHVFAFFRSHSGAEEDPDLSALKRHLEEQLGNSVIRFAADDTEELCRQVQQSLEKVIRCQCESFESRPALDLEIEAHDEFVRDRTKHFTGRESVLSAVDSYIRGEDCRPMVLYGASGSGKSAVMAKASADAAAARPQAVVIRRFIGATPESSSGVGLLQSLCEQISQEYGRAEETPVGFEPLAAAFRDRLALATAERPLVLFVDALDQLARDEPAASSAWLPRELAPHVRVIVSTTAEGESLPACLLLAIEPMTQAEGGQALDDWLRDAGRRLQPWQRERVLAQFARCGLPLYLKLAAEESRLWTSYAADEECRLGDGVAGIINALIARLSSETSHGPVLVSRALGYLAAARHGLTEDEILDLLTANDAVWEDFNKHKHHEAIGRKLPVVVWSRLSLDLEPYLSERAAPGGTVMTFYHRQLGKCAARFHAADELRDRHRDLARYFSSKPAWLDKGRKAANARRAVELVFQQRSAQDWKRAETTLFDCQFLLAKCAAGMALDLDADYRVLLAEAPDETLPGRESLGLVHGALVLSLHVVAREPQQYASQLVGRLLAYRDQPRVARFIEEITGAASQPWIRPLHPCLDPPGGPLLRILEGHTKGVLGVAITAGGKQAVSASYDKTLKVWDLETGRTLCTLAGHSDWVLGVAVTADGKRAVSASRDKTLKVWDLETGRALHTLEGHSGVVRGVAVTADGKRAVSASSDHTLKVWDLETGRALHSLEGHSELVRGVAVTGDGKRAVSASDDCTLMLWDLETGRALRSLEGHPGFVCGVAVTEDDKRAVSASYDGTLKVWDLETGRVLRTVKGDSPVVARVVTGLAVTADGKRAISACDDKTLKVWDIEAGCALRTLEGHAGRVNGVAVKSDGRRAVSACDDKTLMVWDLGSRSAPRPLEGHSEQVSGVAVTADGRRAVSASLDKTLKVWDPESGSMLRTLEGHSGWVLGVSVTTDGKRAVSASLDNTLKVWDLESGRALRTLEGHAGGVRGVAVTADGKRAVSACDDKTLKVWDLESGSALCTLEGHAGGVRGVAVTADGKRAVSASLDCTLRVWDLETGCALRTLEDHADQVLGVAVTADGKRAVSASRDNTLKVWDLETGRAVRTLGRLGRTQRLGPGGLPLWVGCDLKTGCAVPWMESDPGWVFGVAVTADGKRVVSASRDKTLKVWELESGSVVATFYCDANAQCCACAAPNLIVAGDSRGRLYFLSLGV